MANTNFSKIALEEGLLKYRLLFSCESIKEEIDESFMTYFSARKESAILDCETSLKG